MFKNLDSPSNVEIHRLKIYLIDNSYRRNVQDNRMLRSYLSPHLNLLSTREKETKFISWSYVNQFQSKISGPNR